ncbi:MAG: ATP-binding protein [Holophaga sp.]|nr:ATP-binding protein [Holophaga sp.]
MFPWFLLIAIGLAAAQVTVQYFYVNADIDEDLDALCNTVKQPVAQAVWEMDRPALNGLAGGILRHSMVTGIRIVTDQGETLVAGGQPPPVPGLSPWLHKQKDFPLYFKSQHGNPVLIGNMRIHSSPAVFWQRLQSTLIMALLSSLVMTAALWFIIFATLRSQLAKTVTGVATTVAGWHSLPLDMPVPRIEYPYRDELGGLVDALNENRAWLFESMGELNGLNRNLESLIAVRTADLLQAKERAEAADRIKSAFLATMSHELRTPLNSIIGFTGILIQGMVGPLNEEQKKQLGIVRESSNHLLALINDVLDISKIEAGQLELSARPFDLRESLEKTVQGLLPAARQRGVELDLRVADGPWTLTGDRRRVEQIIMNLASNAIKFTEHGSVRITCSGQGAEVEVRVQDTGIGISAEDIGLLFRPFRQVDSGTTRKYEGTGLGLSICKRLVEMMGGRIWVESVPGEGSTFAFALPVNGREP